MCLYKVGQGESSSSQLSVGLCSWYQLLSQCPQIGVRCLVSLSVRFITAMGLEARNLHTLRSAAAANAIHVPGAMAINS